MGLIGDFHEYVAGTVHFRPDVSYLLFLEPAGDDPARYLVVGMSQGAYRIYQDETTHEERVIDPFGGVYYGTRSGSELTTGTAPLTQFQQQVSKAVRSPVVMPKGTVLAVRIEAASSTRAGRLAVRGRTAMDAYPGSTAVVPVGSEVEGTAMRVARTWKIDWTDVLVRRARVPIAAASEEPADKPLRGKLLQVKVR